VRVSGADWVVDVQGFVSRCVVSYFAIRIVADMAMFDRRPMCSSFWR